MPRSRAASRSCPSISRRKRSGTAPPLAAASVSPNPPTPDRPTPPRCLVGYLLATHQSLRAPGVNSPNGAKLSEEAEALPVQYAGPADHVVFLEECDRPSRGKALRLLPV